MNLSSKPSSGDDDFSAIFIKNEQIIDKIVPYLTKLINQSLSTGIFPDTLKLAKVIPIFKSEGEGLFLPCSL